MTAIQITAAEDRRTGFYQFYVDGQAAGVEAEPINAGTDSNNVAALCGEFIESLTGGVIGEVTHDKDTIFVEVR